jgi:hypothetical protein
MTEEDGSEARRFMSGAARESGADGVLPGPDSQATEDIGDVIGGSALHWPACECGRAVCPDYASPAPDGGSAADGLRARLAERNKQSRARGEGEES